MLNIRPVKLADASFIQVINDKTLGYDYPLDKTTERLNEIIADDQQIFLVAELDGKVAGYVQAEHYLCSYFDPMYNVLALAVSEEFQHQGIGKQLMAELEVEAVKRGVYTIRLNSGEPRKEAHQFYQGVGFEQSGYLQKRFIKELEK